MKAGTLMFLVLGGVLGVVGAGEWVKHENREKKIALEQRTEQERVRAEQERKESEKKMAAASAAAQLKAEQAKLAADGLADKERRLKLAGQLLGLDKLKIEFTEAQRVALNTGRIALAGPIGRMQDVLIKARAYEAGDCAAEIKGYLIAWMSLGVDGMTAFMGKEETRSSYEFDRQASALKLMNDKRYTCNIDAGL